MNPVVLFDGKRIPDAAQALREQGCQFADVIISCGQGCYFQGEFYAEFHDRGTILRHSEALPRLATAYAFNCAVVSGGFTQPDVPWISEAESTLSMLNDARVSIPSVPLVLDQSALDSSENLLLGLMSARLALGTMPIRRIGISAAWKWKNCRFMRNAIALGVERQTYFFGLASADETTVTVEAKRMSREEFANDLVELSLLRAPRFESIRRRRWQNNSTDPERDPNLVLDASNVWSRTIEQDVPVTYASGKPCSAYRNRLVPFRRFVKTWAAITNLERLWEPAATDPGFVPGQKDILGVGTDLQNAFRVEVIEPEDHS